LREGPSGGGRVELRSKQRLKLTDREFINLGAMFEAMALGPMLLVMVAWGLGAILEPLVSPCLVGIGPGNLLLLMLLLLPLLPSMPVQRVIQSIILVPVGFRPWSRHCATL